MGFAYLSNRSFFRSIIPTDQTKHTVMPHRKTALALLPCTSMKLACECSLCKQEISMDRQMPMNTILIEAFGMCPSCRQKVSREIEDTYLYRRRWLTFVNEISKRRGWDWQYVPGAGFRRKV
jgi:hypothetical protein